MYRYLAARCYAKQHSFDLFPCAASSQISPRQRGLSGAAVDSIMLGKLANKMAKLQKSKRFAQDRNTEITWQRPWISAHENGVTFWKTLQDLPAQVSSASAWQVHIADQNIGWFRA